MIAAAVGLPFYFLTREWIGTSNAATGMVILMLPAFMFAMYEKDGLPLEKILLNVIHVKLRYPAIRRYEIENLYEIQETVTTEKKKERRKRTCREKEKEMIDRRTSLISKGRKPMKEAGPDDADEEYPDYGEAEAYDTEKMAGLVRGTACGVRL